MSNYPLSQTRIPVHGELVIREYDHARTAHGKWVEVDRFWTVWLVIGSWHRKLEAPDGNTQNIFESFEAAKKFVEQFSAD